MKKALIIVLAVAFLAVGGFAAWRWWRRPLHASFSRGAELAQRLGCFGCHGPGGTQGIPNPGSAAGRVPSWDGGTLMMYAKNENEIREWILDGMPRRIRDDPALMAERANGLIHMPSYRGILTPRELNDLVAYFRAIAWADPIQDPMARKGREIALERGCFGCHGPEGRSATSNPGSLKGYIPPWDSPDFNDLVRSDEELEEWIMNGVARRFQESTMARYFLERQKISMPAYADHLELDELEALKAYIRWIRAKLQEP